MKLTEYLIEVLQINPEEIIEFEPAFQLNLMKYVEGESN